MSILVFPTLAAHRNTNPLIPVYAASALGRVAGRPVHEVPVAAAADAILRHRPRLALGIGSVARGETDFAAIRRAARAAGTVLAYWLHDEPYERDFAWRVLEASDWVFGNDRAALDTYGGVAVSHLPLAASLPHHFAPPIPMADRTRDVFFCGYAYPNRIDLVGRLRPVLETVRTGIFGAGWPDDLPFCRNQRLGPAAMIAGYGGARLTLNVGRHYDLANRRLELVASTPGPRTFEAAAAGSLQAVFVEGLEIFDLYRRDAEILAFDSVDGFAALVADVIAHPAHYDGVVAAAQARTRADHTYDARMRTLLARLAEAGLLEADLLEADLLEAGLLEEPA